MKNKFLFSLAFKCFFLNESISVPLNIALGRPVVYACSTKEVFDSVLTDGVATENNVVFEKICGDYSLVRLMIKIVPISFIQSVIVHTRDCKNCDNILDHFLVKLIPYKNSSELITCGQYAEENYGGPLKVNCDLKKTWDVVVTHVVILPAEYQLKTGRKALVGEIEIRVHEYIYSYAFFGCYETLNAVAFNSVKNCKTHCISLGYRFTTLSLNKTCYCTSKLPSKMLSKYECSQQCKGEIELLCGDSPRPLYIAMPPQIINLGCYEYTLKENEVATKDDFRPFYCIKECADSSYIYAFLMEGKHCYCSNSLSGTRDDTYRCKIRCPGGPANCGGLDTAQVYTGCIETQDQTSCTEIFSCSDPIDEFGKCTGECDDRMGQYCLHAEIHTLDLTTTEAATRETVAPTKETESTPHKISQIDYRSPVSKDPEFTEVVTETTIIREKTASIMRFFNLSKGCQAVLEEAVRNISLREDWELPPSSEDLEEYPHEERGVELRFTSKQIVAIVMITMIFSTGSGFIYGSLLVKPPRVAPEKLL